MYRNLHIGKTPPNRFTTPLCLRRSRIWLLKPLCSTGKAAIKQSVFKKIEPVSLTDRLSAFSKIMIPHIRNYTAEIPMHLCSPVSAGMISSSLIPAKQSRSLVPSAGSLNAIPSLTAAAKTAAASNPPLNSS